MGASAETKPSLSAEATAAYAQCAVFGPFHRGTRRWLQWDGGAFGAGGRLRSYAPSTIAELVGAGMFVIVGTVATIAKAEGRRHG